VDALASCCKQTFRENILLTHKGLSGPAILQISSYWNRGESISVNLLPDENAYALLQNSQREAFSLSTLLGTKMPQRFARAWTEAASLTKPMKQYSLRELRAIADRLHQWNLKPQDTEGFGKAEVTAGGVNTDDLSSKTMESRHVPGLYFIGEIVDVTGWLGGYNFQWAWASGFAAGSYV
jgi:predicted Rossmann fold flavoprotein